MIEKILNKIEKNIALWVNNSVLISDLLYQLLILIGIFILVFLISKFIKKINNKIIHKVKNKTYKFIFQTINDFISLLFLYITLVAGRKLIYIFEWKSQFLISASIFAGSYLLIKIILKFIHDSFWRKLVAIIIWLIAILDMLNLLEHVTKFLDSLSLDIGSAHISVITFLKGILFLFIMIWIANLLARKIEKEIGRTSRITDSTKIIITKSIRILFIAFAGLISLRIAGINLTSFTFLSGAIGFGVGFGLQKIFANIVSGFILIFDKSIKPGDVIEIDGNYGKITSLNPRHITMVTLDGKELLIPNEDLVTQKVVNWSYSDKFIRVSVMIGISYNTDVPFAMKLAKEAVYKVDRISKIYSPQILLDNFNNSSIDIEIKFWIADPEQGIDNVKSDLRLEIWKLFKENNIEIPYPQRDIHIIRKK